jgi:multidrug transporter EmrE-like cation transporter
MTFYIILYLILTVSGLVLMKSGLAQTQLGGLTELIRNLINVKFLLSHWKFVLGILCYGLSFITWMFLLSKKELSMIYPLTVGIVYALIMAASVVFFHEQFTLYKIIGVVLIGVGILFLVK